MSERRESISSGGVSLPQWMRSRIEKPDMDGLAFSPPSHDEFFYIKYPNQSANCSENKSTINQNNLNDVLQKGSSQPKPQPKDFSKHTEPCKLFLNKESITAPIDGVKNPPKPFGTDDGFKGPSAACGSSIVKVAQLMVSGRSLSSRGFTLANLDKQDSDSENPLHTKTIEDQQLQSIPPIQAKHLDESEIQAEYKKQLMVRRGSKSLPASPLGSPKSMRKYQPNPYFTGGFAVATGGSAEHGRSWLLSSLLGVQREAVSTTSVNEAAEDAYNQSAESAATTTSKDSKTNTTQDLSKQLKAKPSELREMNFWSPTSM